MSVTLGNKFCSACGNELLSTAVVCPKCGSPTPQYRPISVHRAKSKANAVVLAVFLGPWSWLYTYKVNGYKFWISLGATWLLFWTYFVLYWQDVDNSDYFIEFQPVTILVRVAWLATLVITWLWALLENAIKSQDFYANYPSK
jgi:hypothetical protein